MSVVKEFREFVTRGNVADMAVGIIIGAAFGKIVTSLVNDIIMPPIGVLIGGVDFKDLSITLADAILAPDGAVTKAAVTLNYGNFVQTMFDFLITAFAIFMLIKVMNKLRKPKAAPVKEEVKAEPVPTKEEILLTEIRDLLKNK
ncbi:MAG: large conductance mechanosensitive channel protein MscL [Bacteroidetes bacterium HGW-Bacteroidetes-21]|jgi:large conductance mechanosensitive channel|nr:MAG: large conductance mechanosensitive channel protein MscL [Bacteroidetes bacterium HGW-Bacteroidetes-21]